MKRLSIITTENIQRANEELMRMSPKEIEEVVKDCPVTITEKDINNYYAKIARRSKKLSAITREDIMRVNEELGKMSQEEIAEAAKNCPLHLDKDEINSAFTKACKRVERRYFFNHLISIFYGEEKKY